MTGPLDDKPSPLGDLLKGIVRKARPSKKSLEGRRLAQQKVNETLGALLSPHATVASVKTGVVTIEVHSAPLFQELEGFRREELLEAFRNAGMQIREVRVRLAKTRA